MRTLSIDIETFSSADLAKTGVYKYCESPDFEILLFAYSFDSQPVRVVELAAGEDLPDELLAALTDPNVIKRAWNANFELVCISMYLHRVELRRYEPLPPEQWECTMVKAGVMGQPMKLGTCAKVLKLDVEKDVAGTALINYFSKPCKPTKANGMRTRNLPQHNPEKWRQFVDYCRKDVEVEQAIGAKNSWFTVPAAEMLFWHLDQHINNRGAEVHMGVVNGAIDLSIIDKDKLVEEAKQLTGLPNPNSVAQLKKWLSDKMGKEIKSLGKDLIAGYIDEMEDDTEEEDGYFPGEIEEINSDNATVRRVLQIRQQISKSSIKKYNAIERSVCADGRVRGMTQFYGASRTGRFAGRIIQFQNLTKSEIKEVGYARDLVIAKQGNLIEMLFDSVPSILSQLVRTAIVAAKGNRFMVIDYSSIERIVAAWLAGEQWVIDEYKGARKLYEKTAAKMFNVPFEAVTKESEYRKQGKIADLACQYGGAVGAIIKMDKSKSIPEEAMPGIVAMWRKANPKIVRFWKTLEDAAIWAVKNPGEVVPLPHNMSFFVKRNTLFFKLPSGRCLAYFAPKIGDSKFGNDCVLYQGLDDKKVWAHLDTYGGKLFENLCQSVARDCLREGMFLLAKAGYEIVFHVHDEVVLEMPEGVGSMDEVYKLMTAPIPWAKGLPLAVEGFETAYYKK